ncbi:MAG: bifunctional diaminohydroxyphosphoribosylaminopyrimidine deaminase/5-amino-6-(5-phosphoribosylamino)uracil reductase RibD [Desulfitobacteriaceae bacterium]|nr:bifunctional diaminohydroxyphosphoribosylaminopyrimidine deaminase/5-amino-6-(5-phosphoribosylamino)uracil reductase RibD [Desulfitobacteriaceae bacterium]
MTDESYMRKALELAQLADGWTSPNPMVGAVIVRDGKIVGEGYHQKAGTPHAEVHALRMAGKEAKGATLFVTLEPCCHHGRTPPCVDAILDAKVARVVAAMEDPNPQVAGRGLKRLRQNGVEVNTGVLENEARVLNEVFLKRMTASLPFVAVKSALTLDGKIATKTGSSRWITGQEARLKAHRLRHKYDGIVAGIGTILADNPQLTVRIPGENFKNPVRIVIDSSLKIPSDAQVLDQTLASTLIYTARPPAEKVEKLESQGVKVIKCPGPGGRVDLNEALKDMFQRGITSVLVEGGAGINGTLLDGKLIDKMYVFYAPKVVGSHLAPGMFAGSGVSDMKDAVLLDKTNIEIVGSDVLITGYPVYKEGAACSPDWWRN